jgi:hypothetical protein
MYNQPPGTFIVRFAERHAGQFAVAYIASDSSLCHYLLKPTDTAGAKITLPDFLRTIPQFSHVLRFIASSREPRFSREPKNEALGTFYSRALMAEGPTASGYDGLH